MINLKKSYLFIFSAFFNLKSAINLASPTSILLLDGPSATFSVGAPITGVQGTIKITDKSAGSITKTAPANTIEFVDGGSYYSGNSRSMFIGTLDPDSTDTLLLDGNKTLDCESGTIAESITVSGTGNRLRGAPELSQAITLTDGSTELDIGLTGKLTQNIDLNGGKVTLSKNLFLQDNVSINGNGTLDLAGHTLKLPAAGSTPLTGNIDFDNAADIEITNKTVFNGNLNINDATFTLVGNGVILDLSGGGNINCNGTVVADFVNVHIRGIGATGGSINPAAGATIRFVNCTIELDGNYTISQGTVIFDGANCRVVSPNGEEFIVGGTTSMTVDSVTLEYDNLDQLPKNPFTTSGGGSITKTNGGEIRSAYIPGKSNLNVEATSNNLEANLELTPIASLTFENGTPGTPKAVTLDGQGNIIKLADISGTSFNLEENITLTVTNTILENYDPAKFSFAGAGGTLASVEFSDGVILKPGKDLSLTGNPIEAVGDVTLDLNNLRVNADSEKILMSGANKTLTIKNGTLKLNAADSLKVNTATSDIQLQNMNLMMTSAGATFDEGDLLINGDVSIEGTNATTPDGISRFSFTTAGNCTVNGESTLTIKPNTTFLYSPDVTGDGGDPAIEKYHLTLANPSSTLFLNHATLETGPVGFALDHGQLRIGGKSIINITAGAGNEFEVGSALIVDILPGAVMDIDGELKYKLTTFP